MLNGFREKIAYGVLILRGSLLSFQKNNNFQSSAALAYYGFFALIPLLLLVVYLLGHYIMASAAAFHIVEDLTSRVFPDMGKVILKEIYALSTHKKVWGVLSIITLFWSITPLTTALRNAFFTIFKSRLEIPFLKAKLRDALAVMVILVLFIFMVLSEVMYSMVVKTFLNELPLFVKIGNTLLPFLLTVIFISFLYIIFPPVKLRPAHILTGAVLTAVMWSMMRPVFTLFLRYNPNYGFAFGSLKAIFIMIIWVYYAVSVILFATEVVSNLRKKEALLLRGLFLDAPISVRTHSIILNRFTKQYVEGEAVFREGDGGNEMFHIISGEVAIIKAGQVLRVMRPDEYFGEMSMLLGVPRTAEARVEHGGAQLVVISRDNFETILSEDPSIVLSLLREMAGRLKATDESI
jgi:YihY family inner membrane protein